MELLRKHIAARIFWLILALHFFNISADTDDLQPYGTPEDLNFNDIESIAEIVLEVWFNISDAIPESDEHDNDSGMSSIDNSSIFDIPFKNLNIINSNTAQDVLYYLYLKNFRTQYSLEFTTPPPKVC